MFLRLCLAMNTLIIKNSSSGKIDSKNVINPTAELETNVSKYSDSGSTVTSTIKCRTAPSNMLRILSAYGFTVTCIKAITVLMMIKKYQEINASKKLVVKMIIIINRQIM